MTAVRVRLPRRLLWTSCALLLGAATLLAGCGTNNNIIYGTGVVTLSGTPGDFTSYVVGIDSITLTRNDGLVIEPLGTSTSETADLAKLQDLTELIETYAFPVGTYTTLSLFLDFSAPTITTDVNGQATTLAPVDINGNAMTSVTLTVNFDPNNPLVINNQEGTRLALDFNLAAFNTINVSASTVTVVPFMTATPAAVDARPLRARGILVITQPGMSNYIVNMRPFDDLVSALGALTVNTTSGTYFNVDGVPFQGAAGLAAMMNLQVSTPIAAYGTLGSLATITPTFNATEVYAGASLESPLADYLTGTVSARSGDTLTIHGATFISRITSTGVPFYEYANAVPVTLSATTPVTEDGVVATGLSVQSISVGQQVNIAGQATINSSDIITSLDATSGAVRLSSTPIWGTLNSATPGAMSLNLLSLAGFTPAAFNFAGTGSASNAAAASYAVNTGSLNESGTAAGTLLEAFGNVTPFGAAPPDFTAAAVTTGSATPQQLVVQWGVGGKGGATAPFSSASSAGLVVNLANTQINSAAARYLATGPQKTDLTTLAASPTIAFAAGTTLTLSICNNATISIYNSASAFAAALATTLNGTNAVYRLAAVGQYDSASNTFTATQVAVNLEIPAS